mmetsp:Transcript_36262/g.67749  ORF Transcript_36262/g.67749 Transcript_36262/m.67749 type:complete len:259 (-) Transcript_36262:283-1059(-)
MQVTVTNAVLEQGIVCSNTQGRRACLLSCNLLNVPSLGKVAALQAILKQESGCLWSQKNLFMNRVEYLHTAARLAGCTDEMRDGERRHCEGCSLHLQGLLQGSIDQPTFQVALDDQRITTCTNLNTSCREFRSDLFHARLITSRCIPAKQYLIDLCRWLDSEIFVKDLLQLLHQCHLPCASHHIEHSCGCPSVAESLTVFFHVSCDLLHQRIRLNFQESLHDKLHRWCLRGCAGLCSAPRLDSCNHVTCSHLCLDRLP